VPLRIQHPRTGSRDPGGLAGRRPKHGCTARKTNAWLRVAGERDEVKDLILADLIKDKDFPHA
jgi:hypothetical protein